MKCLQEYGKLLAVALVASLLTVVVMQGTQEPQVVHAAPQEGVLPPIFKKGATIQGSSSSSSASSTSGKVLSVWGTWVEYSDDSESWWVDINKPDVYFSGK